jgi:DNA gyrase/topoisomerase IV subunit A
MATSSRLEVLEAVAAVVEDPGRFMAVLRECRDEDEARTRIMTEYDVDPSAANHMLETPFRRLLPSQRDRIQQEIIARRHELAG